MLKVVEYGVDEYEFPALIVLGCFDAIHLGHKELLKKAKLQAKINGLDLGVMMFKDGKNGKLLYSFEERIALLEQFNVKFVLAVDFNDEFKSIAPLDFLASIEDKINVKAYMSGKDFRFGAGAKGKSSTLKNYAEDDDNGVWYMPVKDVDLNGEKISTTLIKSCLDAGNVAKANELLGSEFSLSGEVVKGEGIGTSVVGFPTVNIAYPDWKHPIKHGVYSVKCLIGDTDYQGIANFGNCPTFGDDRIILEAYLENFSGDLYGQTLTVRFTDYIRDIEEFGSAQELSEQLNTDLQSLDETVVADETEQPEETVVEEPVAEEIVVEEQPAEEVVIEEPAVEEEPVEEEVTEEPAVEEELAEEVVTEEPAVEEELAEEVVNEEPAVEEELAEEVVTEEPAVEEELAEEVVTEEPAVEEELAEEVVTEEPAVEEELAEEVVTEEPVVEEEPAEEAVTEDSAVEEELAEEIVYNEYSEGEEELTEEIVYDEYSEGEEFSEEVVSEEPAVEELTEEVIPEDTVVEEELAEEVITEESEITDNQPAEELAEEAVCDEYSEGEEQPEESDGDAPAEDEEGKID